MLLKTTRTAVLTVAALNLLYSEENGCCPRCCAMCWVLQDMSKRGDLNDIVRKAPPDMVESASWWLPETRSVNHPWLMERWMYDCPNHAEEE